MRYINFHTYTGLAGDPQVLLTGRDRNGRQKSLLVNTTGWFGFYRLRKAKKKILKEFELETGAKHGEA